MIFRKYNISAFQNCQAGEKRLVVSQNSGYFKIINKNEIRWILSNLHDAYIFEIAI